MGLNASKVGGSGRKITPLETGVYPGRTLHIIDLGLQAQRPYKGEEKPPAREVMMTYELSDVFLQDEDGNDNEEAPRVVTERFPLHSIDADRAKSTKRYKALDPDMKYGGDFSQLIDFPVNVSVVQNPGKEGRVFENVDSIAPMRQKQADALPALVNKPMVFDLDDPDMDMFKSLYPWQRKIIMSNLEFNGSTLQKLIEADPALKADVSETEPETSEHDVTDPDNPF